MAAPASERAAWHWLRQRSALGEPLGCDCETMGRNALQRASDRLLRHRDTIETRLLQRAADLFDLQPTVTLHDLTSTCCEGAADRQPLARRGHSREKRHDCPPLTLGLVLDASGFVRRSRVLAGNVAEGGTLRGRPARASRRLCRRCTRVCRARARPSAWRRSGSACGRAGGETASWTTLRRRLAGQRRVTAVFRQADKRMLHVRKTTQAESWQRAIHERLGVDASPGGLRKLVVPPRRRKENARNAVPHA